MLKLNLQLFAYNPQAQPANYTGASGLSPEMKTYYDMTLIDEASAALVHDQFGQKRPIPKGNGKTIEFRKFSNLPKATTALTEGVTPDGKSLEVTTITATVSQYGDFVPLTDMLDLTALDNVVLETTKILGKQAGLTLDTVTRNVLLTGTNVNYCPRDVSGTETVVTSRADLDKTAVLTVKAVQQVVAKLRANNAPTINGKYVAIIHPYAAYDLMRDDEWKDAVQYGASTRLYEGELGEIAGVRFVSTSEAKIYAPAGILGMSFNRTAVHTALSAAKDLLITTDISSDDATAATAAIAAGNSKFYIGGTEYTAASVTAGVAGTGKITLSANATIAKDTVVCGKGAAKGGESVFATLFVGDGAYGTTEVTGGGLETFVKQKGSGGTSDPLEQRSTVGWKATKVAELLIPNYLVRVESCSKEFNELNEN